MEWPREDRREAEEPCHLLGCLCSSLFVPSASCRTCPFPDFRLFSVFTFFPVAFAGGWGRDLLPGCTTQLCTVLGHTLPAGDKTMGKPARGQPCPLQPSHVCPCSSSRLLWVLWPHPAPVLVTHGATSCHLHLFKQDSKLGGHTVLVTPGELKVQVCSQHPRDTLGVPNSWDTAVPNVGVLAAGYLVPVTPLWQGTYQAEDAPAAASRSSPLRWGGFGPSSPHFGTWKGVRAMGKHAADPHWSPSWLKLFVCIYYFFFLLKKQGEKKISLCPKSLILPHNESCHQPCLARK